MYICRIQLCNLKYLYLDARLNMSSDLSLDCVMHETLFDLIPEEIINVRRWHRTISTLASGPCRRTLKKQVIIWNFLKKDVPVRHSGLQSHLNYALSNDQHVLKVDLFLKLFTMHKEHDTRPQYFSNSSKLSQNKYYR